MPTSARVFPLLLALLAWQSAHAEEIYKSVDSEGQVTYSSTPPPASVHAEKLKVEPPPAPDEVRQARELAQRVDEQGRELEKKRVEQEAAQKAEEARLRAMEPPPPIVIEKPVYVPRTIYYPPVIQSPPARPPQPPVKPKPVPKPR